LKVEVMDTVIPMPDMIITVLVTVVDTKTTASPARAKVEAMDTATPMQVMENTTLDTVVTKALASPERDLTEGAGDIQVETLANLVRDHHQEVLANLVRDHHQEVLASPVRDPGQEDLASLERVPGPEEEAGDILEETRASLARDHLEEAGVDTATQVHTETTMVTPMARTVP